MVVNLADLGLLSAGRHDDKVNLKRSQILEAVQAYMPEAKPKDLRTIVLGLEHINPFTQDHMQEWPQEINSMTGWYLDINEEYSRARDSLGNRNSIRTRVTNYLEGRRIRPLLLRDIVDICQNHLQLKETAPMIVEHKDIHLEVKYGHNPYTIEGIGMIRLYARDANIDELIGMIDMRGSPRTVEGIRSFDIGAVQPWICSQEGEGHLKSFKGSDSYRQHNRLGERLSRNLGKMAGLPTNDNSLYDVMMEYAMQFGRENGIGMFRAPSHADSLIARRTRVNVDLDELFGRWMSPIERQKVTSSRYCSWQLYL
jgi:hypothetical protein